MSIEHPLLARITDKNLRAAAEKTFGIAERFAARRQSIYNNQILNEYGRLNAIEAELKHDFGPSFRLAGQSLRDARSAIDARRAKVTLPAIDPTDVVTQLRHMEIRATVAALDQTERIKLLTTESTDQRILDAVLYEHHELCGLPRDLQSKLLNRRLHQLHGPEMAALEHDERALEEAEAAVTVARQKMKATAEPTLDGRQFDRILDKEALNPWLVDRGSFIAVVKIDADGKASYPKANELEQRTGKFFKNIDEYKSQAA